MTAKEMKRLSRRDLLEMMLALSKENEQLRNQLEDADRKLSDRIIAVEEAGSLAEAALRLSGIFQAAEVSCEQYTLNLQARSERQEQICRRMEQQIREKCDEMIALAEKQAEEYRMEARKIREQTASCS